MAFGETIRQIGNVKDVLDALRPGDLVGVSEAIKSNKPSGPGENTGSTIFAQVHAMQKALKPEDELVVLHHTGIETIRVL